MTCSSKRCASLTKVTSILTRVSIATLDIAVCLMCWWLLSDSQKGMFYGVFGPPPSNGLFAAEGPNYYELVNFSYACVVAILIIYSLLSPAVQSRPVGILRTVLISFLLLPFWSLISFKLWMLTDNFVDLEWYPWLQTTAYLDGLLVLCALGLLVAEVLFAFVRPPLSTSSVFQTAAQGAAERNPR